jgi:TonB family protein
MRTALSLLTVGLLSGTAAAQTNDPVADIQTLYNAAAYEEALTRLGAVEGVPTARVERYRAFCLLALGRRDEAVASVAKAVGADPLWIPAAADASPRVQAFYTDERRKLLPDIVRAAYADARSAYQAKEYPAAIAGFTRVKDLLASSGADAGAVADLGLLADDFLTLSRRAAAPPPVPAAPSPSPASGTAVSPSSQPAKAAAPAAGESRGPIAINQKLPTWTRTTWFGNLNGLLHVEIDEKGAVASATIVRGTQPQYDAQVLEAARSWRYEPALIGGRPVPSSKDISFVLKP